MLQIHEQICYKYTTNQVHFEVVETCLDKIRRCPLNCPNEDEWHEYSINSWPLLQPMLEIKWWMNPLHNVLKKTGLKNTSRKMRYAHFEFVLDSVNSFRRAHIRLMKNLYEKSEASWEILDDPVGRQHHALNPLVLLLVREEIFDALRMADEFYRDMVSGNRDYMISSASKSVVRHLLKDIESSVKHEYESGEIDANEKMMMKKVIKNCQFRLRVGNLQSELPSLLSILKNVAVFSNLSEKNLEAISCQSMEYHVAKNKRLFTKGKGKCSGLFLIVAGSCEIHDENDDSMCARERLIASNQKTMGGTRVAHAMSPADLFDEPVAKVSTNAVLGLDALLADGVPQSTCIATSMVVYIFIPLKVIELAKLRCGDVNVGLDEILGKKRQHLKRTARRVRNSIASVIRGSVNRLSVHTSATVAPISEMEDLNSTTTKKIKKRWRNSISGMRQSLANMVESKPTISFGVGELNLTQSQARLRDTRDELLKSREGKEEDSDDRPSIRRTQSQQSRLSALFKNQIKIIKRAASVSGITEAPVLEYSSNEALFMDQALTRETAMHLCLTTLQRATRKALNLEIKHQRKEISQIIHDSTFVRAMQGKCVYIDHAMVLVTGRLIKVARDKNDASDMKSILYGRATKNIMGANIQTMKAKREYLAPCIIPPGPKGKYMTKLDDNEECVRVLILRSAFSEYVANIGDTRRESVDSIGRRFSTMSKGVLRNTKTFLSNMGETRVDNSVAKQHGITRVKVFSDEENSDNQDERFGLLDNIHEDDRTKFFERMTGIMEEIDNEDEDEISEKTADL